MVRFVVIDSSISNRAFAVMPKLKPDTQRQRREHILDAAEHCFAKSGFHRCTMQDICKGAGISPGALYVYFNSKEDLIAGLCERDRTMLSEDLGALVQAPDLMAALEKLGQHYVVDRPRHKQILHVEIGAEATRNDTVGEMFRSVDCYCKESLESVFARAREEGRIAPDVDDKMIAQVLAVIGDGMFWRRAIDPDFDAAKLLPVLMTMISALINPAAASNTSTESGTHGETATASASTSPVQVTKVNRT